ncbi:hypothetical protein QR680_007040 [Steinernema hermaphroditum]|uniref:Apple domain-containing protein n=1 Tax=Steinernema hermaphroditum TaxID=289476 RepID=A0AA39HZS8_9BILA|nr:hypothetical protein QR680_007040 [Steinernema hermaphroditum]
MMRCRAAVLCLSLEFLVTTLVSGNYHYRATKDFQFEVTGDNQLVGYQMKDSAEDCMKWCSLETGCTGGVFVSGHKACHLLSKTPKIEPSRYEGQTSFLQVNKKDMSCGKSLHDLLKGLSTPRS